MNDDFQFLRPKNSKDRLSKDRLIYTKDTHQHGVYQKITKKINN